MRRADRLLQIIQIMRRARAPITAQAMAEELEVSVRTLYRDITTLESTGVPIRGEAGIGYVLEEGFDLPPLMFTVSELEAIMLGARMVENRGDAELVVAAQDVVAKISAVLPDELRTALIEAPLYAPRWCEPIDEPVPVAELRKAMRHQHKIRVNYTDGKDETTERVLWPISIGYFDNYRMLVAWCELREDFRHFRTDRMNILNVEDEKYRERRAVLVKRWRDEYWPKSHSGGPPPSHFKH